MCTRAPLIFPFKVARTSSFRPARQTYKWKATFILPGHVFAGQRDGILSNHSLPCGRVCCHKYTLVQLKTKNGVFLKFVQLKRPLHKQKHKHIHFKKGTLHSPSFPKFLYKLALDSVPNGVRTHDFSFYQPGRPSLAHVYESS